MLMYMCDWSLLFVGMLACIQRRRLHWCVVTSWSDFSLCILTSLNDFIIDCVRNVASICTQWDVPSPTQVMLFS